jgi:hypothetical protein
MTVLGIMELSMDRSLITVIMVIKEWIQVIMEVLGTTPAITKNQPMMSIKVLNSNS